MQPKLKFFWIAEYNDGQCLTQFNFETGKETLFNEIDTSRLVKFGWYPFTVQMFQKVIDSVVVPLLPKYELNLRKGDVLFAKRRNYIQKTGRVEKRFTEYLLGNQYFYMVIDESGNCEIKYDR